MVFVHSPWITVFLYLYICKHQPAVNLLLISLDTKKKKDLKIQKFMCMDFERMEIGNGCIQKTLQGCRGKTGARHTNREFRQGTKSYQTRMNVN